MMLSNLTFMIEISGASTEYEKKAHHKPLENVNFRLSNEKVVIIGPNGSGKTTLLRMLLGLTNIVSGSIEVFGKDVRDIRKETGLSTNLLEVYRIIGSNVRDTINIYAKLKGSDPDEAFDLVKKFDIESVLGQKIYNLSSGQQKLVGNILSLSFSPSTVLLDEPFDNVDQGRRMKLLEVIEEIKAEVVLNTHELDLLKRLKTWPLYFMIEGKLFGKFNTSQVWNLYLNRGEINGNLAVMDTSFGKYSITENMGQVHIASARNLNSAFEEVA